jgi:predicted outer membrane protein
LSQFAQQRATSSEVKEFAQMMVQDHQKMIQQLQQLSGSTGSTERSGLSATATAAGRNSTTAGSTSAQSSDTNNDATSGTASTSAGTAGTRSRSNTSGASATGAGTNRDTASSVSPSSSPSVNSLGAGGAASTQAATNGGGVQQIMQIDRQIVERKAQATREELQKKSGADFDKAFVGTAINAHIHALAALDVIGQQAQGQLAQVAQQSRPTVQQHLEHAKQIMKNLEGEAGTNATAARPTDSRNER